MDLQLQDKAVLVTGGASGIGEAIVRGFAAEGAKVAIVDRDVQRGSQVADEIVAGKTGDARFVETDLWDEEACGAAVASVGDKWNGLDIVINNAGANDARGLDSSAAEFEESLIRNLTHYYAIVHHAADHLRAAGGSVVNIGSKVSHTGQGGTSGYAAAKGAVNALTREWAVDFAPHGVRVNTVIPAEVWTPMYETWLNQQPDGVAEKERIEQRIPLEHRFTTAEEIADAVVFLASPRASHITGQIIHVDGGYVHLDRRLG